MGSARSRASFLHLLIMSEYPEEWTESLRDEVRARDAYMCSNCSMTQVECQAVHGRKLAVHHKDANKQNCSLDNLTALCPKCHGGIHESEERIL